MGVVDDARPVPGEYHERRGAFGQRHRTQNGCRHLYLCREVEHRLDLWRGIGIGHIMLPAQGIADQFDPVCRRSRLDESERRDCCQLESLPRAGDANIQPRRCVGPSVRRTARARDKAGIEENWQAMFGDVGTKAVV